jgi:hypothetical protein
VSWPPQVGEPLPRASEAVGITEKLRGYVLAQDHRDNQGKAHGFLVRLGIDLDTVEHLADEIRAGIANSRVSSVRPRPYGLNCVVEFEISGTCRYSDRSSRIRTIWHLRSPGDRPRLITAFLR